MSPSGIWRWPCEGVQLKKQSLYLLSYEGSPWRNRVLFLILENCALGFVWSNLENCGWKYSRELISTPPNFKLLKLCLFSYKKSPSYVLGKLIFEEERGVCVFSWCFAWPLCGPPSENQDQDDGRFLFSPLLHKSTSLWRRPSSKLYDSVAA